ncbi:MAG: hypothetical protein ACKOB6_03920, partial [Candidatus Kapaibacterium sp.]
DTLTRAISGSAGRFTFLQSPLAPFARDSAKPRTIGVRYSAGSGGRDSVAFGIVQYNPSVLRMGSDTTISYLCGVSVRQDVRLAAVRGRRAVRNGDTVEVGSWTVGARDSVTVTMGNNGDLPFFSRSDMQVSVGDGLPFVIIDSLHRGRRHIAVQKTDSMRIVFAPEKEGEYVTRVTLRSDIGTRVKGAPDSVSEVVFHLRGVGRRRSVTSGAAEVDFDCVVVNNECPTTRTINLRVRNSSSENARITGIRVFPPQGYTVPVDTLTIAAQSDGVIPIVFAPTTIASYAAVLIVQSAIDDGPLLLQLSGVGVRPGTMDLRLPSMQSVFPGHEVMVPLWGRSDLMNKASRCTALLDYDSTVLAYTGYDDIDGAAASGDVRIEREQGMLRMRITMASTFFTKDTLIRLRFRSMLGLRDRSPLSVVSVRFGSKDCEEIFTTSAQTSVVVLDSLCGLADKLPRGPVTSFSLRAPHPHPLKESGIVTYTVATGGEVRVGVYNLVGECIRVLATGFHAAGPYAVELPSSEMDDGVYVMRLQSGMYREDVTIVVSH